HNQLKQEPTPIDCHVVKELLNQLLADLLQCFSSEGAYYNDVFDCVNSFQNLVWNRRSANRNNVTH
ncbi:hypothetical protein, partial [Propionivibrio sp.]|uniref:hypothetical protein n=1 Tax=Propionivibrio sp. TaxID=2212460 RepID=UPI003BF236A0